MPLTCPARQTRPPLQDNPAFSSSDRKRSLSPDGAGMFPLGPGSLRCMVCGAADADFERKRRFTVFGYILAFDRAGMADIKSPSFGILGRVELDPTAQNSLGSFARRLGRSNSACRGYRRGRNCVGKPGIRRSIACERTLPFGETPASTSVRWASRPISLS